MMPVFPRSVPFPVYQYKGTLFSVVALGTGPLRVQQETHHNTMRSAASGNIDQGKHQGLHLVDLANYVDEKRSAEFCSFALTKTLPHFRSYGRG